MKLTPHEIATLQEVRVAKEPHPRSFDLFRHEETPYAGPPLGGSTTTIPVATTTIIPTNAQGIPCAPEGSYALEGFDGVPLVPFSAPVADAIARTGRFIEAMSAPDDGVLRQSDLANRDSCNVCGLPVLASAKEPSMRPRRDDHGRSVLLDGQPVHDGCVAHARAGSHVTTRSSSVIDEYLTDAAQSTLHKEGT
jgi:hypothetical protein